MRFIFLMLAAVVAGACRNEVYMVETSGDPDFSGNETYAFLPPEEDIVYNDDIVRLRSIQQVKNELDERGFSMNTDNPDLLIEVRPMFSDLHDDDDYPAEGSRLYPEPRDGPGVDFFFRGEFGAHYERTENIPTVEYVPGTIVVDVYDVASRILLWSGWFEMPIDPHASPEDLEIYFDRLFEKFPTGEGTPSKANPAN